MPEVIVLDTHIWFWWMTRELEHFPKSWQEDIEAAKIVGVSPISCYEVALAHQRGRLELPCATDEWLTAALDPSGITLLPLTDEIAARAVNLSPIHKDPFDRMIIATALSYGGRLASIDRLFPQYNELKGYLMI